VGKRPPLGDRRLSRGAGIGWSRPRGIESLRIHRLEPFIYSREGFERLARRNPPFIGALLRNGLIL
jgi:hypothetical protein